MELFEQWLLKQLREALEKAEGIKSAVESADTPITPEAIEARVTLQVLHRVSRQYEEIRSTQEFTRAFNRSINLATANLQTMLDDLEQNESDGI